MDKLPLLPVCSNPKVGARTVGLTPDTMTHVAEQLLGLTTKYVTRTGRETDETAHAVHTTTTATTVSIKVRTSCHISRFGNHSQSSQAGAPRHSVDSTSPPLVPRSISGQSSTDPRYTRTTACILYQPPLRNAGISNKQQMLSIDSPAYCRESSSSIREDT